MIAKYWIDEATREHDANSKELVELLTTTLRTAPEVQAVLEETPGVDLGDVPWPAEFRARRFWTTYIADLRGTPALRNLVQLMAMREPRLPFRSLLELRLTNTGFWYAVDDALDATFVGPGRSRPMVDRSSLRDRLRLLHEHGYRTLNITGGSASGKTFSLQLVQLLLEREGLELLHVDVADWGTEKFTAVSLVEAFGSQLGVTLHTELVEGVPDPHTRARLLLYELRGRFPTDGSVRWIVIDGMDRANVEPDARALVERLLKSIDVDAKPNQVRLIVTGFDGLMPADTCRDPISAVVRDDVRELFKKTATQLGTSASDDLIESWTDIALGGSTDVITDLATLGASIYATVQSQMIGGAVSNG